MLDFGAEQAISGIMEKIYITVEKRRYGERFADFSVFLPTGSLFTEYRFSYLCRDANPALDYGYDTGDSTNCELYRINEAYIAERVGENFLRRFRVLQGGEISFALREFGASDFVGGIHGDERIGELSLFADGAEIPLDREGVYSCESARFCEDTYINRCNTPDEVILFHRQKYDFSGREIRLSQSLEWLRDSLAIDRAFTPMLTVQRRYAEDNERTLTDTIEFYGEGGALTAAFDTSPYGTSPDPTLPRRLGEGTHAATVKVYGKESGLCAHARILAVGGSLSLSDVRCHVWPRFNDSLDSKIYFSVYSGDAPVPRGTVWTLEIKYGVEYATKEK